MSEEKKQSFSISEMTKKISIFFGIVIPAAGLYYNTRYYKTFNINITDFIDPAESLMMFFPKLTIICAIIGFAGFPTFICLWYLRSRANVARSIGMLYLVLTIPVLYFVYKHSAPTLVNYFILYYVGMWALMALPLALVVGKVFLRVLSEHMKEFALIYLTVVSVIITISTCELNSAVVQKYRRYKNVNVSLQEGSTYSADTMNIYVGHTKHFLFIWSKKTRITSVYSIEKVKKFEFDQ